MDADVWRTPCALCEIRKALGRGRSAADDLRALSAAAVTITAAVLAAVAVGSLVAGWKEHASVELDLDAIEALATGTTRA